MLLGLSATNKQTSYVQAVSVDVRRSRLFHPCSSNKAPLPEQGGGGEEADSPVELLGKPRAVVPSVNRLKEGTCGMTRKAAEAELFTTQKLTTISALRSSKSTVHDQNGVSQA